MACNNHIKVFSVLAPPVTRWHCTSCLSDKVCPHRFIGSGLGAAEWRNTVSNRGCVCVKIRFKLKWLFTNTKSIRLFPWVLNTFELCQPGSLWYKAADHYTFQKPINTQNLFHCAPPNFNPDEVTAANLPVHFGIEKPHND